MSENLVPTVRTALHAADVYACLQSAWAAQLGTTPSRASLLVLLAQWDLETGGGAQALNYNCAGIKYTPGCGHDYAEYQTHEGAHSEHVYTLRFRAYSSLDLGVADWLHELRATFGYAWPAVEAGSTAAFAHSLKMRGYYSADEHDYAGGLAARYAQLDRVIAHETPTDPAPADNADLIASADEALENVDPSNVGDVEDVVTKS